jgi:hypothetical protein
MLQSCSFDRDVVIGNGDVVHVGWIYPHPSGVGGGVGLYRVNTGWPDRLILRPMERAGRLLATEKEGMNRGLPASSFSLFL